MLVLHSRVRRGRANPNQSPVAAAAAAQPRNRREVAARNHSGVWRGRANLNQSPVAVAAQPRNRRGAAARNRRGAAGAAVVADEIRFPAPIQQEGGRRCCM